MTTEGQFALADSRPRMERTRDLIQMYIARKWAPFHEAAHWLLHFVTALIRIVA